MQGRNFWATRQTDTYWYAYPTGWDFVWLLVNEFLEQPYRETIRFNGLKGQFFALTFTTGSVIFKGLDLQVWRSEERLLRAVIRLWWKVHGANSPTRSFADHTLGFYRSVYAYKHRVLEVLDFVRRTQPWFLKSSRDEWSERSSVTFLMFRQETCHEISYRLSHSHPDQYLFIYALLPSCTGGHVFHYIIAFSRRRSSAGKNSALVAGNQPFMFFGHAGSVLNIIIIIALENAPYKMLHKLRSACSIIHSL